MEKLDRTNYASWSHGYLLGHRYWSYVQGANDGASDSTHKTWYRSDKLSIKECNHDSIGKDASLKMVIV